MRNTARAAATQTDTRVYERSVLAERGSEQFAVNAKLFVAVAAMSRLDYGTKFDTKKARNSRRRGGFGHPNERCRVRTALIPHVSCKLAFDQSGVSRSCT
jgi:hypothetical protein